MFLLPLLLGFACNSASAFTAAFSRRWGKRRGQLASLLLRDVLGIPLWAAGLALASLAPSPWLFPPGPVTTALGWQIILTGAFIILLALRTIGLSSLAPSVEDTLINSGLYAYIRHPINTGAILEFVGLAILRPRTSLVVACMLGVAWALVQSRLEEVDLLQRLPAYKDYMKRVPRFLPRLRGRS
jgi:protein-S-isoprenylcysteine O-methyltransferase Ste14